MSQFCVGETGKSFTNNNFFNAHTNSFNNNSFNTVNNFGGANERAEILAWLSPLDPLIRHDSIRVHRVKQVGDWLLQTEEYQNWFDGNPSGKHDISALFFHGDPGVGKTFIR